MPVRNAEKKIARYIAQLPSERLLKLARTQDQINLWLAQRYFRTLISKSWTARHSGKNDPVKRLLESQEIDRDTYDRVWLVVDYYEQLWGLVQLSFGYVRSECVALRLSYPFKEAVDLFFEIIRAEVDNDFSICLSYHEVSARKHEKALRLLSAGCTRPLNPIEDSQLKAVESQYPLNKWFAITLAACEKKATRTKPALKGKLQGFYDAASRLFDKEATIYRKVGSFAWSDGEIIRGKIGGSYFDA